MLTLAVTASWLTLPTLSTHLAHVTIELINPHSPLDLDTFNIRQFNTVPLILTNETSFIHLNLANVN